MKSSSLIGGSAMIKMVIGLAKAKASAIFLGPEGVGLVGLYTSLVSLLTNTASLGMNASGVREIAAAAGSVNATRVAHVTKVLRRMCWLTGALGWVVAAALAIPLSLWTFDSKDHALAIAVLGAVVLLGVVSAGQMAVVQGMRRIADLAKFNVVSAVLTATVAILCYWAFGMRGIVPALLGGAMVTLLNSWYFSRRISLPPAEALHFAAILHNAKSLVGLGLSFMWSGTLQSTSFFLKSAMIIKLLSIEANGLYSAAWTISGLMATTVLGAMAADYYPRLTAASMDHGKMRRLVSEQAETGMLLSLPIIVTGVLFAPLALSIIYSSEFAPATQLLQLFCLGMFGKVVSWPLGFIMLAKSKAKLFAAVETISVTSHLAVALLFLHFIGLQGIGWAFVLTYIVYTPAMIFLGRFLIEYRLPRSVLKLILSCGAILVLAFIISNMSYNIYTIAASIAVLIISCVMSARGLFLRLKCNSRLNTLAAAIPGLSWALRILR